MELTIDQALQQGVVAHKEGKLQDAERLYRAILQAQPKHPDANHNLGVLAVAVGKPLEALPLFQQALDGNPQIEQFWLSYMDALIRLERFDEANRVLVEGEKAGLSSEKLGALKSRLAERTIDDGDAAAKSRTLMEKRKRLAERDKNNKTRATSSAPRAAPSQDQINGLLVDYQAGRLEEAEEMAKLLSQQFPNHPFGWKVLGAVYKQMGRLKEALLPMQESVDLSPKDAEAHNNLGITLQELGKLEEAEASLRQALALKPDYAKAHNNLGNILQDQGKLEESISSYIRATSLEADFDVAYSNLGTALKNARFSKGDKSLYPILINLLTQKSIVRPADVAGAVLSLLRLDDLVVDALLTTAAFTDIKEVDRTVKILDQVPLLHQLMRVCPLPDLQLEALFVSMRRVILSGRRQLEACSEFIHFLATLSLHCFTNEYVYFETTEEADLINVLEASIAESIAQASQPTITDTLILATYRPLHQYDWSENLQALDQLPDVKARLVEEPLAERLIAQNIPALSNVNDDVSRKVREQYEESPYPRWVQMALTPKAKSIAVVCSDAGLLLHSENIKNVLSPSILVAGCGTGQHSIRTASRFANCKVTAIDLSRASLAYAQRKTRELGIASIEYIQADILNLGELGREFDIVESSGVLHHMDDPMAGWQVLVGLLRTGGLMKIGLYSELARRPVVKTRDDIALREIGTSASEIRKFRQSLVESHDEHHQQLAGFGDLFSLSEFRDLVFHVQEHRFTLPKIHKSLDELGLKFCGFVDKDIVRSFRNRFGKGADACDLALWHQFEENHPRAFAGMYQFWCQRM